MHPTHRMDGYVRVSRTAGRSGESFISPTVQREQIEGWARLRGVEIVAWHEDLDQSGGKLSRPGLDALLERIEGGLTSGVAVAKLDRLSRLGVGDALKLVERITDAGGSIAAVDLGLDPTTPFGEFGMTIMLAMARMERRRLADSWAIAQSRAIERGVSVSRTPLGYGRKDGVLVPDDDAVHVTRAFELAAARGIRAATDHLAEHVPSRRWTTAATRRILGRRVYLGEARHGEHFNATAHEPLVSASVWKEAQHKARAMTRAGLEAYPLSGLIHCATCGSAMAAGPRTNGGKLTYRCSAGQTLYRGLRCVRPATIVAESLEAHVRNELRPLVDDLAVAHIEAGPDLAAASDQLDEAEAELDAFAADLTLRRALGDSYHEHLASRVAAVEEAREQHDTFAKLARTLETWDAESILDPQTFGLFLGRMRLSIQVRAGRGTVEDRVTVAEDFDLGARVLSEDNS